MWLCHVYRLQLLSHWHRNLFKAWNPCRFKFISITALKRACRKIGLSRWPRKNDERVGYSHELMWSPSPQQPFAYQLQQNTGMEDKRLSVESIKSATAESAWAAPYPPSESRTCCGIDAPWDLHSQEDMCCHIGIPSIGAGKNGPMENKLWAGIISCASEMQLRVPLGVLSRAIRGRAVDGGADHLPP
jgi:hypothetical protein